MLNKHINYSFGYNEKKIKVFKYFVCVIIEVLKRGVKVFQLTNKKNFLFIVNKYAIILLMLQILHTLYAIMCISHIPHTSYIFH